MEFKKLSAKSKRLLDEILNAENPSDFLYKRFDNLPNEKTEELRAQIRGLCRGEYISVPIWADDRPYHVVVNESASVYNELLEEYEKQVANNMSTINVYHGSNHSIQIGNGNSITNSQIGETINAQPAKPPTTFYERHPVICAFLISLAAGLVLLFPIWSKLVQYLVQCIKEVF